MYTMVLKVSPSSNLVTAWFIQCKSHKYQIDCCMENNAIKHNYACGHLDYVSVHFEVIIFPMM